MFDSSRWRVLITLVVAASALAVVSAPINHASAATECFTISVDNAERMDVPAIDEASGLVLSRQMPGVMWTHNDDDPGAGSSQNNRIYAVDESGDLLATVQFTMSPSNDTVPGSKFVELEDISYGAGPNGDPNYLYLADTGDNNPTRSYASIYRFPEPVFSPDAQNPITINVNESQLDGTRFQYQSYINPAQIKARNVEGVFVDPAKGHLFLFEKGLHAIDSNGDLADASALPREYAFVYRITSSELFPTDPTTMRLATVESYVKGEFAESTFGITAADISADGTIIAIKNSEETFYWVRDPNESVLTTFNNDHTAPCLAPTGMKGEGLAIGPTSDRFVLIREGLLSPIWQAVFTDQVYECFGRAATILGTAGDDVISGTAGHDVIVTFGGNDEVRSNGGKDRICLGPGDDFADAGRGVDRVDGGWGDDEILGNDGNDRLWGGDGKDAVSGNADDDSIYGDNGADTLAGGSGADDVRGMAGADSVVGKGGADNLSGGKGTDSVNGGAGNDSLAGGGGIDACDGGDGTDTATSCEDITRVP
ncbi:MAG: calcium-binding protein [bacterium]|nr:calcium-binding protein [bacterium]